jgi:hypothetical protein
MSGSRSSIRLNDARSIVKVVEGSMASTAYSVGCPVTALVMSPMKVRSGEKWMMLSTPEASTAYVRKHPANDKSTVRRDFTGMLKELALSELARSP